MTKISDENTNYNSVILEEVREQYKAIKEGLDILSDVPGRLDNIEASLEKANSRLEVVEAATSNTLDQVDEQDHRITGLEEKTA